MGKITGKTGPTIGLEIHVELNTKSKMFCGCVNSHFRVKPNTQTCPVCLGLPGALPYPNKRAVEWALMIGLALKSRVNSKSKFDRKHYFYPDLSKAYQISQYDEPLCTGGYLETSQGRVRITRVHLEEDTGKLLHRKVKGKGVTLVDFNRSGVPLVEIVTKPDIRSGAQAKEFAQKLRSLIRYLGVSNCDMEKGSMRLEANISLGEKFGYKVEVKNLNSFRYVGRAIDYELGRQAKLLNRGKIPKQETRGWNEIDNKTIHQRYKETAADYRYFPEPDIPPMRFGQKYIDSLKKKIPKLPDTFLATLKEGGVRPEYARILTVERKLAKYAVRILEIALKEEVDVNRLASIIVNRKVDISKTSPEKLIEKMKKGKEDKITDKKRLAGWVAQAIKECPQAVSDYKKGRLAAISVLIGYVMKISKGKADASLVRVLSEKKLKKKK